MGSSSRARVAVSVGSVSASSCHGLIVGSGVGDGASGGSSGVVGSRCIAIRSWCRRYAGLWCTSHVWEMAVPWYRRRRPLERRSVSRSEADWSRVIASSSSRVVAPVVGRRA